MSNDHSEGFFKGLVFGILGGAVLGVIFAPAPGKETRKKLQKKGEELRERAMELADELEETVGPLVEEAKTKSGEIVEDMMEVTEPAREAAQDKLEDLEKELAKTKKRFFRMK